MGIRVSIITVTYNCVNTIEQTIKSVHEQSYPNIEYIVVDGMSTDGTWEKICKYKDQIDVIIHEPDEGLYYAMNKGLCQATGEIVGIINGDDWYDTDAITTAVNSMNREVDIIYGNIWVINSDGGMVSSSKEQIQDIWYNMIPHPSVFVRREVYSRLGGFDTGYSFSSDYEMLLRFYVNGARFRYVDYCFAYFRKGGITSVKILDSAKETAKISLSYFNKCENKEYYLPRIKKRFLCEVFRYICLKESDRVAIYIGETFGDNETVCVFGAGFWGERVVEKLAECNIKTRYVIDNSISKIGSNISGVEIVAPSAIAKGRWSVIIALVNGHDMVEKQLKDLNNPELVYSWFPMLDCEIKSDMESINHIIDFKYDE